MAASFFAFCVINDDKVVSLFRIRPSRIFCLNSGILITNVGLQKIVARFMFDYTTYFESTHKVVLVKKVSEQGEEQVIGKYEQSQFILNQSIESWDVLFLIVEQQQ